MTDDLYLNVYLTNLGKYNEGELLGKWVEVTTDTDWKEELKSIGVADNTEYEEYFITDLESNFGLHVNEYTSLQELNEIAEKIEEINNENLLLQSRIPVELLSKWKEHERVLVLITGHRRENFGKPFIQICESIKTLSLKYSNVDFVYPMHLNPNVRKPIYQIFGDDLSNLDNMFFIEPLEYLTFVYLMEKSLLVLTDSGGIQEEAPGLGKPVLVMRDTTERPEGVEAGTVKLVGTSKMKIVDEVSSLLENHQLYMAMSQAQNPYGDGYTSVRISEIIKRLFSSKLS